MEAGAVSLPQRWRPFGLAEDAEELARQRAVTKEEILSLISGADAREPAPLLLDARSGAQYRGAQRRARRGGHIPTAVSVPYRSLLRDDGVGFLDDEMLYARLGELGISRESVLSRRVLGYCNGGVASTAVLFALARCGVPWERLVQYDGSWNEWGNLGEEYPVGL